MLLTNFAAGELSENLFGRTDLPEYFQAAARLENFDLIPSGGIEKRRGARRVLEGLGDGRLIPFIISREESYLLFFTGQTLVVYRAGQWESSVAAFAGAGSALYTDEEAAAVQHAQHYDRMVLVHENHPPLELRREKENTFTLERFQINNAVTLKAAENFDGLEEFAEFDETYRECLVSAGHYPRAVTFLNSRILFAGTKQNPQRIFASRVNDIHDFSTYKKFLTEKREYLILERVEFDFIDNSIKILDTGELGKFDRPFDQYYVDSPRFPPGTKIAAIIAGQIYMTRNQNPLRVTQEILDAYIANVYTPVIQNDTYRGDRSRESNVWVIRTAKWTDENHREWWSEHCADYRIGEIRVRHFRRYRDLSVWGVQLNWSAPTVRETYYFRLNKQQVAEITSAEALYAAVQKWYEQQIGFKITHLDYFGNLIADFFAYNQQTMMYPVSVGGTRVVFYGTPGEILQQLSSAESSGVSLETSLPLYTREVIVDKHPAADDGFTFELASDRNDQIRWLVLNKYVVAGTETAEYVIPPDCNAVTVSARLNSFYGSSPIQASSAGDAVLFFRDGNKGLVEYYIPQADNYFRTNDLLRLAPQMLRESAIVDFDIVTSPHTRLFITRADGSLVTLLYDRSFGLFAWARYSLAGRARGLAVLPGADGYDDLYILLERGGRYELSVLSHGAEAFLDSYTRTGAGRWEADAAGYDAGEARVVRVFTDAGGKTGYEERGAETEPDWNLAGDFYIGYPYRSVMRSMPVLTNNQMKKQRITGISFRFLDSFLPRVTSIAGGRPIQTDTVTGLAEPYSGVWKIPFPGTWDEDAQVELTHDRAAPARILALNAEAQ